MFRTLIPAIQHVFRSFDGSKSPSAKKSRVAVAPLDPHPQHQHQPLPEKKVEMK